MFSAVKTNEGHSQRSNCRKHHDHVLSSYHYWRCMWLRLSVREWVFVRIHQGVKWNYFLATKEHFDCHFFGTEKIALFHFGSFALLPCLPPISYLVWMNLCSSGTDMLLFIYSCCSVVVNRGGFGQGTRNGTGSAPSRFWYRTSVQTTLAGRKSQKAWTNSTCVKTSSLFVQPSCCSLFEVQHSETLEAEDFLIQPVVPLSDHLGHDIKLLLDTNTVTF